MLLRIRHSKTKEELYIREEERKAYPGWRVIEKNVARPRAVPLKRERGRWRIDREEVARERIRAMTEVERFQTLEARIKKLEEQVEALKSSERT